MAYGFKTGGREKGTPNKYSLAHFRRILNEEKCDPFRDLVKLIPNLQPHQQASVLTTVLSYVARRPDQKGDGEEKPTAGRRSPMSAKTTDELLQALQTQKNDNFVADPNSSEE